MLRSGTSLCSNQAFPGKANRGSPLRPIHISSQLPRDSPTLITGAKGLLQQGCDQPLPAGDRRRDRGPEEPQVSSVAPEKPPPITWCRSQGKTRGQRDPGESGVGERRWLHSARCSPGTAAHGPLGWVARRVTASLSLLLRKPTMSSLGRGPSGAERGRPFPSNSLRAPDPGQSQQFLLREQDDLHSPGAPSPTPEASERRARAG